jgi:hypothetical protein
MKREAGLSSPLMRTGYWSLPRWSALKASVRMSRG